MSTEKELLRELCNLSTEVPASSQKVMFGKWYEYLVEIDNDHTAYVLMTDDAYEAMNK